MSDKPHILCVDDEPRVLDGLALNLRKHYRVSTALNGHAALQVVDGPEPPIVVVSDMRMPEMDGASLLTHVRERAPDITRILLTGQADIVSAVAAVNHGQVFRFLTKPSAPQALLAAIRDAVEQHRLVTAEKVLLEQTLRGSIAALAEALSLSSPLSFGRALRIKNHVAEIARAAGIPTSWQLDVAATLSQIGSVMLPDSTSEKLYYGRPLACDEAELVERLPQAAIQLIEQIPRLEQVRSIVEQQNQCFDGSGGGPGGDAIPQGSRILKIAIDFDMLEASGMSPDLIFDAMTSLVGRYDPALLAAFARSKSAPQDQPLRELTLADLRVGMVLARDVEVAKSGKLLIGRGQRVTGGLLQQLRNMGAGLVREPLVVRASSAQAGDAYDTSTQQGEGP
jgi:response regulator RpfG family c-di-GMP phosphodiesterase